MNSYIYIRDSKRNPVGCIAYETVPNTSKFDENGNLIETVSIRLSMSLCAKEDRKKFTKEGARKIADARVAHNKVLVLPSVKKTTRGGYVRAILEDLASSNSTLTEKSQMPTAVRTFSKMWVKQAKNKDVKAEQSA